MSTVRKSAQTILLAAIVLVSGVSTTARAGVKNVTTNTSYALEESVFNPETGETVSFSGEVRVIAHTKFFADGTVKVSIQCDLMDAGIGEKTGDSYKFRINDTHEFTFNATGFPFTVTLTCDMHLLNKGSANDVTVPLTVSFIVQKDGSVFAWYVEDGGGDTAP